jgi:carboxymethylenebutenolidase
MCFAFDARPPELPADLALLPVAGGAAAETVELESAGGTRFSAALAVAPGANEPAVVVLPDVRGLHRFYVELAERFAQAGHSAVAIDYFGRTAGLGERGEDFDYMAHVQQTRVEGVQADTAAAIELLRERTGATSFVTVGFCFGGTHSFLAATNPDLPLAGVVGFYGGLAERPNRPSPIARAGATRCPVLGLFGGADDHIPRDQIDVYDAALEAAGVEHELVSYPGAPHSFFDRSFEEHADACEDAWRRMLSFLERIGVPTAEARS